MAGTVVEQGSAYGHRRALAGQRVNLEFVSANPTGPIHIGGARWAAVGDALARMLRAQAADVTTEYYFNDAGAQIDRFAGSLLAAARQEAPPDDGYAGEYISEIAGRLLAGHPGAAARPDAEAREIFRSERRGADVRRDQDVAGRSSACISTCTSPSGTCTTAASSPRPWPGCGGRVTCTRPTAPPGSAPRDFGDDKDRVYVRSNGEYTYFAADCAYYLDKRGRGFGKIVIILGADHHGYVGRMRAIAACFGDDPDQTLEILIGQLVNLVRDGEPVRMSKRAGAVVTIDDLVDALGVDAARYALARYSLDSTIDLDLGLWTRRSNDNPVYYVQYAHARIASLLRKAADSGITRGDRYDASLLSRDRENDLLRGAGRVPGRGGLGGRATPAAPGGALPRGTVRYLSPLLRRLPGPAPGRRALRRARPGAAVAGRGGPDRPGQRPGTARRQRSRPAVIRDGRPSGGAAPR